jgi:hypothetical protein
MDKNLTRVKTLNTLKRLAALLVLIMPAAFALVSPEQDLL